MPKGPITPLTPMGVQLKDMMKRTGRKGKDVAVELGIHPAHLSRIMHGRVEPTPELSAKIAELYFVEA